MEQRQSLQKVVLEKLDIYMQKKKMHLDTYIISLRKINSKWITDLNLKYTTVKQK